MRRALSRLAESLDRIRSVAADMDTRVLRATSLEERDETMRCAATVILSGFFESFIKDCVKTFLADVSRRNIPFLDLPATMQVSHFNHGGQLVGQKARNQGRVTWVDADHLDIARRLASPQRANSYELVWEAFANTQGNPGPNTIESVLRDLGLSKCATRLNAVIPGGYQRKRLALESFIAIRNECAHSGSALQIPTTSDLREFCDLIELFATAIVDVLERRLGESPFAIDLNKATADSLSRIPGMGPVRIAALLTDRSVNGRFQRVEDVQRVPGFQRGIVKTLKLHLYV